MTHLNEEILIRCGPPEPCRRCDGPSLLSVRYPHSWENGRGDDVTGIRENVLCADCDRGAPPADELIALLAVDQNLDIDNIETFGGMVAAWVEHLRQQNVEAQLQAEYELWQQGAL